ncbi:MAG: NAD(P)-dependent oxidoreductase, partial [Planctomycetaceae bacterium]|nr:NAD(P)-dependent oxidoreductase [Planctomycetaceae bacterium]
MHAVVVGGSGQIGGWLLRTLAERGHSGVGTFATTPFDGLVPLDAADLDGAA